MQEARKRPNIILPNHRRKTSHLRPSGEGGYFDDTSYPERSWTDTQSWKHGCSHCVQSCEMPELPLIFVTFRIDQQFLLRTADSIHQSTISATNRINETTTSETNDGVVNVLLERSCHYKSRLSTAFFKSNQPSGAVISWTRFNGISCAPTIAHRVNRGNENLRKCTAYSIRIGFQALPYWIPVC